LKRLDESRALGLGAEMAFWLFLSLLPLSAVAGLLAAKLASGGQSIMDPLVRSLPRETRDLVSQELGRMAAWNGGKVGFSAGLVFLWLASSGIHSIFDGIEIASESAPRPWWKKRALALFACVALSVGVALLGLLAAGLGGIRGLLGTEISARALAFESSLPGQILRLAIGFLLSFAIIGGLFWIGLPPQARRSMPVAPGALLAIGLQVLLGFGYAFYLKNAGDGGAYQAGLATIGVTLMALYLFCLALLVGVEANRMIGDRRRRPVTG
jgi:membrane protein